ncbi:MAG: TetR/AcrR family transcriptional regulator [Panacagrimonas sp.]
MSRSPKVSLPVAPKPGPARGRPKDPDKRAAILMAAKKQFTAQGLPGTSMEGIAAEAGVSKLTVYSHFKSKEELFRETVSSKCSEHWPEVLFDTNVKHSLRERLRGIASGFLDLVFSDEVLRMYRLMAAQDQAQTQFGRLFWAFGPERTLTRLTQLLEVANKAGELKVSDAREAASHFFILLKGEHHIKALVGAAPALDVAARARHIDAVLKLFLRAYAPDSPR